MDFAYLTNAWERLNSHSVYDSLKSIEHLKCFMSHHVFSVWDFMSLAKFLQSNIAGTSAPWVPHGDPSVRRIINEIILEEESDIGLPDCQGRVTYASHFELYCQAMEEIGISTDEAKLFIETVNNYGVDTALEISKIPEPAREFMKTTFGFIASGKLHVVAAAFALGREHVIPDMFRSFTAKMNIGIQQAPILHYYLERHIHLDKTSHAPLSLKMLYSLCGDNKEYLHEAQEAACQAVEARIKFWSGIQEAIDSI
jgi:hypothetical protein